MNRSPGTLPGDCITILAGSYLFATSFPRWINLLAASSQAGSWIRPAYETTRSLSHQGLFFHMPQR
ncbi:MAG: hypothetical protein WCE65_06240 [Methanoregula sp.]